MFTLQGHSIMLAASRRCGTARPTAARICAPRPFRTTTVRVSMFKDERTVKLQEREHMLETVHDWFEAVSHPLIHLGPLLSDAPVLIDRIGGGSRPQRTEGVEAIEVRLAELHHAAPLAHTLEKADVVDVDHCTVCANWVCSSPQQGDIHGSYTFKFDAMGRIAEIHHHLDADMGEFLDA